MTQFPAEVWEILCAHLENHHLARLYETGDFRLRHALSALRFRRVCFVQHWPRNSRLIQRFLVGTATHVTTIPTHFEPALLAGSRLRALTLADTGNSKWKSLPFTDYDLTSLKSLQSLDIDGAYRLVKPLRLPRSMTTVRLGKCCVDTPVHALERLSSLTELSVSMDRDVPWNPRLPPSLTAVSLSHNGANVMAPLCGRNLPLLTTVVAVGNLLYADPDQWPTTITDLTLLLDVRVTETAGPFLPPGLRKLDIGFATGTLDVSTLLSNQCHIESVVTSIWTTCAITDKLPRSLKSLHVHQLALLGDASLAETMSFLPASLERLSFTGLVRGKFDEIPLEELVDGLSVILPRLCLEDLENAWCHVHRAAVDGVDTDALLSLFLPHFRKFGLDADYVAWLRTLRMYGRAFHRRRFNLSELAGLFKMQMPAPLFEMVMRHKIIDASETAYDVRLSDEAARFHHEHACQLLDGGFTSCLRTLGPASYPFRHLSPMGRRHLTCVLLYPREHDIHELEWRVRDAPLPRLNRIVLRGVFQPGQLASLIDTLYKWRAHLPALECIQSELEEKEGGLICLDDESLERLAAMRLYRVSGKSGIMYYPEPPPRRVVSKRAAAVVIDG